MNKIKELKALCYEEILKIEQAQQFINVCRSNISQLQNKIEIIKQNNEVSSGDNKNKSEKTGK